jgi:hypothetical protein
MTGDILSRIRIGAELGAGAASLASIVCGLHLDRKIPAEEIGVDGQR